jgi:hypothetical protein
MEYNLLLRMYDYHCNLFIDGKICLEMFQAIEAEYIKRKKLFTINLN